MRFLCNVCGVSLKDIRTNSDVEERCALKEVNNINTITLLFDITTPPSQSLVRPDTPTGEMSQPYVIFFIHRNPQPPIRDHRDERFATVLALIPFELNSRRY
ncbi:hypothetical protein EVAR_75059_1 [Eumeta japonica]|uniref:Uncharacterized protein n=1 Tax=Eumeta variegata TaxID=151549 RepID=A0A4C1W221_EUMVA|nr:hypothetical protein EVAR_75059_1 [Eumeta japonica]